MEEIAQQFREEYSELLSRYKDRLPNSVLIPIIQEITRKELAWINRPELAEKAKILLATMGTDVLAPRFEGVWRFAGDAPNESQAPQHVTDAQEYTLHDLRSVQDRVFKHHCSSQEIAEADCDGDIRHCKNACGKLRMNKTTISDAPEFHIGEYFDDQEVDPDMRERIGD